MNRKQLNALEDIVNQLGLSLHKEMATIYGEFNQYKVCLIPTADMSAITLKLALNQDGELLNSENIKQVVSESKVIKSCNVKGRQVFYLLKVGRLTKNTAGEKLKDALHIITDHLKAGSFESCCQECGTKENVDFYNVSGVPTISCQDCFKQSTDAIIANEHAQEEKSENFVAGLVGGFIGALIGVVAIIIFGQLGFVSALSGLIMAVCSLKGYEMLGGKLTNRGIIGTGIIMIILVYVGTRIDWSISFASMFEDLDIITTFRMFPELIDEGFIDGAVYYWDLALVYIFTALGAIPTIINMKKSKEVQGESYRMSA